MARVYDLLADMVESRSALPRRIGAGPWQAGSGENINRQVKAVLRDGLLSAFYPSGGGSCDLTEKGRKLGLELLAAREAREEK